MAAASILTSGKVASSRTKFGGMAVPAAQLGLVRPFQEELSCPFDERRQIFVCEDGALVPEQISLKFHFRELVVGVDGVAESLIAIQSGLKFDCRHPAKVVMLGRVLRPASAVRPTGELAAFLVFRIGRHRQSSWASRPIIVLALLLSWFFNAQITHEPVKAHLVAVVLFPAGKVSDVALAPQQASPSFRGLHHSVIYPHRKEN